MNCALTSCFGSYNKTHEWRWQEVSTKLLARFENPKTYRVFKEVPAVLEERLNSGITVGVVSNWSERLPVLLKALGHGLFHNQPQVTS